MKRYILIVCLLCVFQALNAQKIAVLKYQGGGDWYANPTALPNLIEFSNKNIHTAIDEKPETVSPGSSNIYQYPYVHMTGHGNVYFDEEEAKNLRDYLLAGGFLHIDDNYGMEPFLRKELKKIFPKKNLQELSSNHPIFHSAYDFPKGLPKIHEHDANRPQALAFFEGERLLLLFTFESDLGDGWENPEVHKDPEEVRLLALKMGANILKYVFEN